METITITKRIINGKSVYNKRFDDYETGFWGGVISRKEYEESRLNEPLFSEINEEPKQSKLYIVERITYGN